jgi:hypothetical protein
VYPKINDITHSRRVNQCSPLFLLLSLLSLRQLHLLNRLHRRRLKKSISMCPSLNSLLSSLLSSLHSSLHSSLLDSLLSSLHHRKCINMCPFLNHHSTHRHHRLSRLLHPRCMLPSARPILTLP